MVMALKERKNTGMRPGRSTWCLYNDWQAGEEKQKRTYKNIMKYNRIWLAESRRQGGQPT